MLLLRKIQIHTKIKMFDKYIQNVFFVEKKKKHIEEEISPLSDSAPEEKNF